MIFLLFLALISCSTNLLPCDGCEPQQKLLIIDTDGAKEYDYRNTRLLAESVGFEVDFLNLYDLLEGAQINQYDNVLIFLSPSMFRNLNHEISQKIIKLLVDFAGRRNKFIGILLPSIRYSQALFETCTALLEKFGIFKNRNGVIDAQAPLRPLVYSFIKFILQPDEKIGSIFGTTLVNPQSQNQKKKPTRGSRALIDQETGKTIFKVLPGNHDFPSNVMQALPAGLYLRDEGSNNAFFISKTSMFNFADIAENFWKNPIHIDQRNELLTVVQQMLWEIYIALKYDNMPLNTSGVRPPLPEAFSASAMQQKKMKVHREMCKHLRKNDAYSWICEQGIIAGWLEPSDYFLDADQDELTKIAAKSFAEVELLKKKALDRGINFIYNSNLNLLWFEFNPESFIGENAIWKEKRKDFIENINTIMKSLKEKFRREKKPMPKIFIGTDITTNYRKVAVPYATQDVYGHTYSKIPCPLDFKEFWTKELLDSIDTFYDMFHQEMPIDGIFLDFEMYHAQDQAGAYTDLMDFSDFSWNLYRQAHDAPENLTTVQARVHYLSKEHKFAEYFDFLESQAREIGQKIREHFHLINPRLLIGAYAPTLPNSWFYRGIYSGLGSADWPLILATFNVDYYSHYQWFMDNDIHVVHGVPILLSKFQEQRDFALIENLSRYHDFIWYNRPSRQIYKNIHNRPWSVEASPMQADELAKGIRRTHDKLKSRQSQ